MITRKLSTAQAVTYLLLATVLLCSLIHLIARAVSSIIAGPRVVSVEVCGPRVWELPYGVEIRIGGCYPEDQLAARPWYDYVANDWVQHTVYHLIALGIVFAAFYAGFVLIDALMHVLDDESDATNGDDNDNTDDDPATEPCTNSDCRCTCHSFQDYPDQASLTYPALGSS